MAGNAEEYIICNLCREKTHFMNYHLEKTHPDYTIERYIQEFPGAELVSPMAKKRKLERDAKRLQEAEALKKVSADYLSVDGNRKPISEVFNLRKTKQLKAANGSEIMVSIAGDYEDEFSKSQIPVFDEDYVFPIEVLKNMVMCLELAHPAYIFGHAGLGKTSLVRQICAATKRAFVRVQHNEHIETSDIVGQNTVKKMQDDAGNVVSYIEYQWGPLPLAMKNGWVYCADEYDRTPPGVASIYQAVLEGNSIYVPDAPEGERYITPHQDFRFFATGNTNGSGDESGLYAATCLQDAASLERFWVEQITYMNRLEQLKILEKVCGLTGDPAARLVDFCEKIRDGFPNMVSLTIGPRVMIGIAKIGLLRRDFLQGVALAFSNRLPESERVAVQEIAQRFFGSKKSGDVPF